MTSPSALGKKEKGFRWRSEEWEDCHGAAGLAEERQV